MLEFLSGNIGFFLKVVITHVVTYTVCGMIFYKVNNYSELISQNKGLWGMNWRNKSSLILRMAPAFQILRGILLGIVLVLIQDSIIGTSFGFVRLFVILIITGLINVYQPAPDSIEGFIYIKPDDNLTFKEVIGGNIEIATQILLFSVVVVTNWSGLAHRLFG